MFAVGGIVEIGDEKEKSIFCWSRQVDMLAAL